MRDDRAGPLPCGSRRHPTRGPGAHHRRRSRARVGPAARAPDDRELAGADTRGRRHRRDVHRSRPPRRGDRRRRPGQGGDHTVGVRGGQSSKPSGRPTLSDVEFLAHGTTVVINALTERKGAARRPDHDRRASATCSRSRRATGPTSTTSCSGSRGRSCLATCASRSASGSTTRGASSQPLEESERARRRPRASRRGRRGGRDLPAALLRKPGARAARRRDRLGGVARRRPSRSRTSCRASGASTTAPRRRCSTRTSSRPSAST